MEPRLHALYGDLNAARAAGAAAVDPAACAAPLLHGPQWLDGSAYLNHGRLMERTVNAPPIPNFDTVPVMCQGASDDFLGPQAALPLPGDANGIDFEGSLGVILGPVPMAATAEATLGCVRRFVQINLSSAVGRWQRGANLDLARVRGRHEGPDG